MTTTDIEQGTAVEGTNHAMDLEEGGGNPNENAVTREEEVNPNNNNTSNDSSNSNDLEQPTTTATAPITTSDNDDDDDSNVPDDLICPISQVAMEDPVTLGGQNYNKQHLIESLLTYPDLNPLTGERQSDTPLKYHDNLELRQQLIDTLGPDAYRPFDDSDFADHQYPQAWMAWKQKQANAAAAQEAARFSVVSGVPGLDGSLLSFFKRICTPYVMMGLVVCVAFFVVARFV
mmetsp:Transcript_13976/g.30583  ORF Transcript_13976/g.30583 Transcript_13976/m.30583 type:complete len:232 (+) Transcript_13976:157-852(+)|eukprot:CAMPEP_0168744938 /NCGR_PEP_ID=MMETSP0724-20121128/14353_1 /TAXON_ID=265536 /ORGANISM="Amphiprora sp., Strain CCMP467" /LENGTH=231 /DNA_ID=CAMNT_0008792621 /DNA_START=116 /DNA_END=811 /DNA_ORIENTATION=-